MTAPSDYKAFVTPEDNPFALPDTIHIPNQSTALMTQRRARTWLMKHINSLHDDDVDVRLHNRVGFVAEGKRRIVDGVSQWIWEFP